MIITSFHIHYEIQSSSCTFRLSWSLSMNPMQKWKNVNLPLTFNIISMKTGSLPWHSPLTKQRILPSLCEEILRSIANQRKIERRDREAENGKDRTAGIGYIFRSGAKLASHRKRVWEERVVFFHPSQH